MHGIRLLALAGVLAAAAATPASADVRVSMANGRVSVIATDATVRQILTEWARVGQVTIVNVERIAGGPISIELQNMPEDRALDLLLRSVAGYLAAPRAELAVNASRFDRVVVMPNAAVPRTPVAAAPAMAQPVFNPGRQPMVDRDAAADDPMQNEVPTPTPRGPVFNPFPQPQVVNPQGGMFEPADAPQVETPPQQPAATPGAVSTPGMIVPMPQAQPGQTPGRP